ncbi:hypothetical protein WJX79_006877 [Trebouxia sp. C0005]
MSGQLSQSDRELYHQLRNKYTSGAQAADSASAYHTGLQEGHAAVRVCPTCSGNKVEVETYNFRQMEKTCQTCKGDGVEKTEYR